MKVNGPRSRHQDKEEILDSALSMHGYILTSPGFKVRTCQLCVLNSGDLNVYVRSTPLRVT